MKGLLLIITNISHTPSVISSPRNRKSRRSTLSTNCGMNLLKDLRACTFGCLRRVSSFFCALTGTSANFWKIFFQVNLRVRQKWPWTSSFASFFPTFLIHLWCARALYDRQNHCHYKVHLSESHLMGSQFWPPGHISLSFSTWGFLSKTAEMGQITRYFVFIHVLKIFWRALEDVTEPTSM